MKNCLNNEGAQHCAPGTGAATCAEVNLLRINTFRRRGKKSITNQGSIIKPGPCVVKPAGRSFHRLTRSFLMINANSNDSSPCQLCAQM